MVRGVGHSLVAPQEADDRVMRLTRRWLPKMAGEAGAIARQAGVRAHTVLNRTAARLRPWDARQGELMAARSAA